MAATVHVAEPTREQEAVLMGLAQRFVSVGVRPLDGEPPVSLAVECFGDDEYGRPVVVERFYLSTLGGLFPRVIVEPTS